MDEYIKMEKRYRSAYSVETEAILSETMKFFECSINLIKIDSTFLSPFRCFCSETALKYFS